MPSIDARAAILHTKGADWGTNAVCLPYRVGMPPFFVLSSARAGSTSFARILDRAENGCCLTEPTPNLNTESRLAMDGQLDDYAQVVSKVIAPRTSPTDVEIYGEKNVTYGPFIRQLHQQLDARFILLTRDGRDVVGVVAVRVGEHQVKHLGDDRYEIGYPLGAKTARKVGS